MTKIIPLLFTLLISTLAVHAKTSEKWVDSVFVSLNEDEKICQLMMIAAYANRDEKYEKNLIREALKYHVGGIMFLQGKPTRQAKMINTLQQEARTPFLIALDAEWGVDMRLDSALQFPFQMTLGALENDSLIKEMGKSIGHQLKATGVHINFAPVVDINNNPDNPVINFRSFGENKERVANKGIAYMEGLHEAGIMATAKHFPGHGDTDSDSHYTLPVIKKPREAIWETEIYPFQKMIEENVDGIMIAHLHIPSLDSTRNRASTLSPHIVTDMLKDSLQYRGLIYTDALNMKGVSNYYSPGELEVLALEAGNDVLLMPDDVGKALRAIKKAVKENPALMEHIDKSVRKILTAKYNAGLHTPDTLNMENIPGKLNKDKDIALARKIYAQSITLLQNKEQCIPIRELQNKKIASVAIGASHMNTFQLYLSLYTNIDHFQIKKDASLGDFISLQDQLTDYDLVILGIHNTSRFPHNNYGVTHQSVIFTQELAKQNNTILCHFANPYSLNFFDEIKNLSALLIAYEDNPYTQELAAQAIFGGIPVMGSLPVSNRFFKEGSGIKTKKTRIGYVMPEELGINSRYLLKADSIARRAIDMQATPGCQILAAKDGFVFYQRAFGNLTYREREAVTNDHIYDIASITKIAATIPETMRLFDMGLFQLNQPLSHYLPDLKGTNKELITGKEMLTHQAQLWPWIPFYRSAFELLFPEQKLFNRELSDDYPFKLDRRLYINRNYTLKKEVFSTFPDSLYSIQVAEHIYLNKHYINALYDSIHESKLWPKKEYKYSDLGYYYLQKIIESKNQTPLDELVEQRFFSSLGLTNTFFNPLEKTDPSRIVPTENDIHFRKQLLQGHVHDPGAAMLGGVGGHAGLFSNTRGLAVIMQLYLNKGKYGEIQYFQPTTVELFTSSPFAEEENRRGIGFDKAEPDTSRNGPSCKSASVKSFGHSGFTGTIAWADPDHQLIYIFLSNRIHPNADNKKLIDENIRTNIQQVFYDAIGAEKKENNDN